MPRVTLNVKDSIYKDFLQVLKGFKKSEIKLISVEITDKKHPIFLKNQKELHETLRKIDSGETTLLSMEEFEERLNKTLAKYGV